MIEQTIEAGTDLPEISAFACEAIESWERILTGAQGDKFQVFERACVELFRLPEREGDPGAKAAIVDSLYHMARVAGLDDDLAQKIMAAATTAPSDGRPNGSLRTERLVDVISDAPPPPNPDDYGAHQAAVPTRPFVAPPLSIADWLSRDLPQPDFIMGDWFTTTTRGLLAASAGLGKTNFATGFAMHAAAGVDFLHWRGRRPCKVLYIDGEMSRRLFRQRIDDAAGRLGFKPEGFHALSHEDAEGFAPLNTVAGQAYIEQVIAHIDRPDLIVFDSIMCLLAGDMKDGEAWAQVMPWVRSLTRRCIGQLWLHHTGHDATRSYGDKTKEWQLDTVMHMEAVAREDTDVSFSLEFRKARERTPATRADFQTAHIALIADEWQTEATGVVRAGHVSPLGLKFLDALQNALAGDGATGRERHRRVGLGLWRDECVALGLIDPHSKTTSARTLFNKHKRELIAANRAACSEHEAWLA